MFAVVEFLNGDGESRGEISTVPLLWLTKKSTKCYWPNKTFGIPFPQFVQRHTAYKKSWPIYKIKLHCTRGKETIYFFLVFKGLYIYMFNDRYL